jgi:hypothetical protein
MEKSAREFGIDDIESMVMEVPRTPRRVFVRTMRVPSLLIFPAWVVSNQTRTRHLHLASPVAAFECDGDSAEGLNVGQAYFFAFEVPLEVLPIGTTFDIGYQMKWDPNFTGYHEKGRICAQRGRWRKETERHRWDLHYYERPGAGLKSAIRCSDQEVESFARDRGVKELVQLYDRATGAPHGKRLPWGFMSAVVGGRRMV